MPQVPSWVEKVLLKLKRDDDIEAIVTFTYTLMKVYFTENPDFIQKAVRLCKNLFQIEYPSTRGMADLYLNPERLVDYENLRICRNKKSQLPSQSSERDWLHPRERVLSESDALRFH